MRTFFILLLVVSALSLQINLPGQTVTIDDFNNYFTLSTLKAKPPISYSFTNLPPGFKLNGANLTYTGSSSLQGQFPVQVTATDANQQTATATFILDVNLTGSSQRAQSSISLGNPASGISQSNGGNLQSQVGNLLNAASGASQSSSLSQVNNLLNAASGVSQSNGGSSLSQVGNPSGVSQSNGGSSPAQPANSQHVNLINPAGGISQSNGGSTTISTSTSTSSGQTTTFLNIPPVVATNGLPQVNSLTNTAGTFNLGNIGQIGTQSGLIGTVWSATTTPDSTVPPSSNNIDYLTNLYNQNTNTVITTKNISSYPVPNIIAQGVLPNSVQNTNVISISTSQANRPNGSTNNLTAYDINITNLFNSQTQVSQTIANLLEIIRQGTANSNQAQADINTYTQNLNAAIASQQNLSLPISQAENAIANMQGAISNATAVLNNQNAQLNSLNGQIATTKANGLTLTQQLSVALNNQNSLNQQINNTQAQIGTINSNLNSQSQACSAAKQNIIGLQGNISTLSNSIAGIDQKIAAINSNIGGYQAQIANLQAQINALNNQIDQANTNKQNLINLNYTVPQQIANLNAEIAAQNASCSAGTTYVPSDLTNAQNKLGDLQNQQGIAANNVNGISSNITLLKGQLTDLINQANQLPGQISITQANINKLKQQLQIEQANLSKYYIQGNQILQNIKNSNSSLQAALNRYQHEQAALTVANFNLQQARNQAQNISQQINLILQANTAGIPFPSAPVESGLTSAVSAINSIDSISAFLLRAYGSHFNLNGISNLAGTKSLYYMGNLKNLQSNCPPVILSGTGTGSSSSSSSSSSTSSSSSSTATGLLCGRGTITQVNGTAVQVSTDQGTQTINLGSCTLQLANTPNYILTVGDVLVWKGISHNNNTWTAHQVTCFQ